MAAASPMPADVDKAVETTAEAPVVVAAPPTFNMDGWKKTYSNTDDLRGEAMTYLWEHYKPELCTFFLFHYQRYNDQDNIEAFKASNLLGMFFQRIDNSVRRSAFAVGDIIKRDGFNDIKGVIMVTGDDLPAALKEHDQYPSFTWTKLEVPKDKQLIEDYFCEDNNIDGGEIVGCKVYK